ncbi:MAG: phosphoglycerate dehydrogenase [Spirochaetaceae bacterium]|jgi:D-3-phosphoglycerate dehydrogenase|nr:phosphoglycerate dehydrogenase [Spirochaetaceae bacterium]
MTVLITARSFAQENPAPLAMLEEAGCRVVRLADIHDLPSMIHEADGIIAGLEPYTKELLAKAARLKIISRYGIGCDAIDLAAAKEAGIAVAVTPGANSDSVADLAMALMLSAARHVPRMDAALRAGRQERPLGVEMWRKTLGVIGTGRIGKGVIRRASGFEMNVLCFDTYQDEEFARRHNARYVDLDTLYRNADFITIHSPLTAETRGMIGKRELSLMKKTAVIVNTARGGIIDEDALAAALAGGSPGAAALDATEKEPPYDSPLCSLPNCILTPHAGASTREASYAMGMMAARSLLDYLLTGKCENLAL